MLGTSASFPDVLSAVDPLRSSPVTPSPLRSLSVLRASRRSGRASLISWFVIFFDKVSFLNSWFVIFLDNVSFLTSWFVIFLDNVSLNITYSGS